MANEQAVVLTGLYPETCQSRDRESDLSSRPYQLRVLRNPQLLGEGFSDVPGQVLLDSRDGGVRVETLCLQAGEGGQGQGRLHLARCNAARRFQGSGTITQTGGSIAVHVDGVLQVAQKLLAKLVFPALHTLGIALCPQPMSVNVNKSLCSKER
eukprot:767669-Hanusia_phi.AAC.4